MWCIYVCDNVQIVQSLIIEQTEYSISTFKIFLYQIMGENESRSATISILPATKETSKTFIKTSQSLPASVTDTLPVATKQSPSNPHHTMTDIHQPVISTQHPTTTTTTTYQLSAPRKSFQAQPHQPSFATSATHRQDMTAAKAQPLVAGMKSQRWVRGSSYDFIFSILLFVVSLSFWTTFTFVQFFLHFPFAACSWGL